MSLTFSRANPSKELLICGLNLISRLEESGAFVMANYEVPFF